MLDKSIPFLNVLMKRDAGTPFEEFPLPEGFQFVFYKPGDEKEWAELEAAVLEFPRGVDALVHFQNRYFIVPELERRCLFIEDPNGKKIATATMWWEYSGLRRNPWISYVSVLPEYQGLGLGKALSSHILKVGIEMEGDVDFYLHTQTWSHRAIPIYEKVGFYITDETPLYKYDNADYHKSLAKLEEIYKDSGYNWVRRLSSGK